MIEFGATKNVSPAFDAVVGQEGLKEALLSVAVEPGLGGLLVRGEKGTAKSTAVRGLVDLLGEQRAVADCPYGCRPAASAVAGVQCSDCRARSNRPVETRPVPLVTLPLGATRERVVGSLSVADALDGEPSFDPGLLARANRGILYVDEINLLEDHLVDVILDAAASGVNRVERDGVSVQHPARFTLVGTMNPEEGDLRPQLRDRFSLQVTVEGCRDIDDRVAIIDRALDRTGDRNRSETGAQNGEAFSEGEAHSAAAVNGHPGAVRSGDTGRGSGPGYRERLTRARELLPAVELPTDTKRNIAELCRDAGVDGHRADIATAHAARALAALDGRPTVVEGDVRRAAELALPHRLQSRPFEDAPDPGDVIDDHFDGEGEPDTADGEGDPDSGGDAEPTDDAGADGERDADAGADGESGAGPDGSGTGGPEDDVEENRPDIEMNQGDGPRPTGDETGGTTAAPSPAEADDDDTDAGPGNATEEGAQAEPGVPLLPGQDRKPVGEAAPPAVGAASSDTEPGTRGGGSRADTRPAPDNEGARVRTERADAGASDVDAAASVRAAARRCATDETDASVRERDLRRSVRTGTGDALVVFALDASASMRPAMRHAKGVVLELLRDAYEQRDAVAVVTFAGEGADVVLPPTDSVELAARHLKDLHTDDRTPLPAGLRTAGEVLTRANPDAAAVVLVTDGRANATGDPTAATRRAARALGELDANVVVVDTGAERGLVPDIVRITDGERVPLDALTPERVDAAVARGADGRGADGRGADGPG